MANQPDIVFKMIRISSNVELPEDEVELNAIRAQGGVFLAHEFLSMEVLAGIGAELAMLEEMEDE